MGALKWINVVEKHEAWRIASCMWLHAGVVHVVANMVSLLFVGIRLEQEFGFGMFYFSIPFQLYSIYLMLEFFLK